MTAALLHDVEARRVEFLRHRCRENFRWHARYFWSCIPGAGRLRWNWHLDRYCTELEAVGRRVIEGRPREYDLVVNVPFGTSKSSFFSVLFQTWMWAMMPDFRLLVATHTDSLGIDLADRTLSVLRSEKYQEVFPHVTVRKDRFAKEDFANTAGGERKSCTVGGKTPTGRHAHAVLVDDPLDPQTVLSETEVENARRFITEVLPSRMVDKTVTPIILVMQRLGPRDPTAVMLEVAAREGATPVRHVCLPGEITEGSAPVSPPEDAARYVDGLLDPVRLPRSVLTAYAARMGRFAYSGQVGQNPTLPGGGMFKEQWFSQRVRAAPYEAVRVRYWDRAASAEGEGGCNTAGTLMAFRNDKLYVEDCKVGQWEPNERNDVIVATAQADRDKYGPNHEPTIYVEAERGSTGLESFQRLAARLLGFRVKEDQPTGSKDVRAEPWADQLAAGNVYLVDNGQSEGTGRASWDIQAYIQEHTLFRPDVTSKRLGKWKDRVDSSSGAAGKLAKNTARAADMRIIPIRPRGEKDRSPRIAVMSEHLLRTATIADESVLLAVVLDPPLGPGAEGGGDHTPPPPVEHGIARLLDAPLVLRFADLDATKMQAQWSDPVEPWGVPPAQLVMQRADAKALWSFLLRKRPTAPEVYAFASPGGKRALSLALALADVLRIDRRKILVEGNPETLASQPPNRHCYEMAKAGRMMVV